MNMHFMSTCEALRSEVDPERFWTLITEALARHGVTSILYGAVAFRSEIATRKLMKSLFVKSNHPREFFEEFGTDALLDDDWTAEFCLKETEILRWHEQGQWEAASKEQIKRAEIERDLGLLVGVSIPACRFDTGQVGGIGLSMRDVPLNEFERHWAEHGGDIQLLCSLLDMGMRRGHIASVIDLSDRERECLTWLAAGMRPEQIANRLGIAKKTVDKYLVKARLKLKSNTPEHAVAKAMLFNLISP